MNLNEQWLNKTAIFSFSLWGKRDYIKQKLFCLVWIDLLPVHDFATSCTCYLKNTGPLSIADFLNIDTFDYMI